MNNFLTVVDLKISFGDNIVLEDTTFNIRQSEITGLIGQNGSGKTVLLKACLGLLKPQNGNIIYGDKILYKDINYLSNSGFVLNIDFINHLSAFDNLKLISSAKGILKDYEIYNILEFVNLDPTSKKKYKFFSEGMKQKLRIAQALMEKPAFLVLDECFNGIDKEFKSKLIEELKRLAKQGVTIIITSHIENEINELCNNILYIENRKVMKG